MKLNLSNIGSARIGGRFYGPVTIDARSYHYRVFTNANDHAIGEIPAKIAPCLDFGNDKVWLGVNCLDTSDGSFASGGYIQTISCAVTFTPNNDDPSEIVTFDILGVSPSPYLGGVRIDGLSLPGSLIENTPAGTTGHRYVQIEQGQTYPPIVFNINGTNRYLYASRYTSFGQSGNWTYTITGSIPTKFANNLHFDRI